MNREILLTSIQIWIRMIFPYLYFMIIVSLLMILISKTYNGKEIVLIHRKSIKFILIKFYSISLLFIVVFFSAFRKVESNVGGIFYKGSQLYIYPGGIDAPMYKNFFEQANKLPITTYFHKIQIEPIYNISCYLFSNIFNSFAIFLCFYYIIYSICLIKLSKYLDLDYSDVFYLFSILALFLQGYNTFRCTTAIFLSIFIIEQLINGKIHKAFVLCLLICGIHLSAIIWLIPVCWFYIARKKNSKKYWFKIYILLLFVIFTIASFLLPVLFKNTHYAMYMDGGGEISIVWIGTYLFMIFRCVLNRKYFFQKKSNLILFLTAICFLPIFILQMRYKIAYRFMLYSKPIVYTILLILTKNKKTSLNILLNIITITIFVGVVITFMTVQMLSIGLPYSNYLLK